MKDEVADLAYSLHRLLLASRCALQALRHEGRWPSTAGDLESAIDDAEETLSDVAAQPRKILSPDVP